MPLKDESTQQTASALMLRDPPFWFMNSCHLKYFPKLTHENLAFFLHWQSLEGSLLDLWDTFVSFSLILFSYYLGK